MVDLREWFADHELEPCPCCGRASALPTPSGGYRICLDCGLVSADGERVDSRRGRDLQAAERTPAA